MSVPLISFKLGFFFREFGDLVLHSSDDTGSIPRILRELYGSIVNLEFESLEMSVTEIYRAKLEIDLRHKIMVPFQGS